MEGMLPFGPPGLVSYSVAGFATKKNVFLLVFTNLRYFLSVRKSLFHDVGVLEA